MKTPEPPLLMMNEFVY